MSRANEMRELFARWGESGQSLMAFGKQEGVSYAKLLYWRRKFENASSPERVLRADPAPEFLPISVVAAGAVETTWSAFEVRLTNGLSVDVGPGFDECELRRLVGVLQSC